MSQVSTLVTLEPDLQRRIYPGSPRPVACLRRLTVHTSTWYLTHLDIRRLRRAQIFNLAPTQCTSEPRHVRAGCQCRLMASLKISSRVGRRKPRWATSLPMSVPAACLDSRTTKSPPRGQIQKVRIDITTVGKSSITGDRGRELSLPRGLIASFESIALKTGGWKSRMSVRRMMQVWAAELGVPESVDGSALRTATK